MPLEIRHESDGRVIHATATGPAQVSEWAELTRSEREVRDISRVALLVDIRPRETLPRGPEALSVREQLRQWGAVAIVTRPGAQFGIGRMVDSAGEDGGTPARSFTDLDEARRWLEEHAPGV